MKYVPHILFSVFLGGMVLYPPSLPGAESRIFLFSLILAGLWQSQHASKIHLGSLFVPVLLVVPILVTALVVDLSSVVWFTDVAIAALVFVLAKQLFSKPERFRVLVNILATLLIVECLYGVYQVFLLFPSLSQDFSASQIGAVLNVNRAQGTFINANVMAGWLVVLLPVVIQQLVDSKQRSESMFLGFAVFCGFTVLLLSYSIGAWVSLATAFIAVMLFYRSRLTGPKVKIVILLSTILLSVIAVLIWIRGYHLKAFNGIDELLQGRLMLWSPAFEAWKESFWFGFGYSGWEEAYRIAQANLSMGFGRYPHNLFLSIGLKTGVVGVIAFVVLLFSLILKIYRNFNLRTHLRPGPGIAISLIAGLVHSMWDVGPYMAEIVYLWIVIAAVGTLRPFERSEEEKVNQELQLGGSFHFPEQSSVSQAQFFWILLLGLGAVLLWKAGLTAYQMLASAILVGILAVFYIWKNGSFLPVSTDEKLSLSLLVIVFLGIFNSIDPGLSLQHGIFLSAIWLFWIIGKRMVVHKCMEKSLTLWWFLLIGLMGLVLSLCLTKGTLNLNEIWNHQVVVDVFPNVNLLVSALVLPIVFIGIGHTLRGKWNIFFILPVLFMLYLVYLSGSRGAMVSLLTGYSWLLIRALFALSSKARRWFIGTSGLILILFTSLLVFSGASPLQEKMGAGKTNDLFQNHRIKIWKQAFELLEKSPVRGWGAGTFPSITSTNPFPNEISDKNPLVRFGHVARHAHNDYLEWIVENGIPAGVLLLLLIFIIWKNWLFDVRTENWKLGLEAAIVGIAVHAFFDFDLRTPFILWLLMVLLILRNPDRLVLRPGGNRSLAFVVLMLFFTVAISMAGAMILDKKETAIYSDSQKIRHAQLAYSLNPTSVSRGRYLAQHYVDSFSKTDNFREFRSALSIYQQLMHQAPENGRVHRAFAGLLLSATTSESEDIIAKMSLLVENWEKSTLKGFQLNTKERYMKLALDELEYSLNSEPFNVFWLCENAGIYFLFDLPHKAHEMLDKAIEMEPNLGIAWDMKLKWYLHTEQFGKTQDILKELGKIQKLIPHIATEYQKNVINSCNWKTIEKIRRDLYRDTKQAK